MFRLTRNRLSGSYAAFGEETFERLQALKLRYDPDNILRRNQNIPPA